MYWYIYDQNSACDHIIIELYYFHLGFYICMIAWQCIDCIFYYYVDRSNSSLIVRWLFENQDFIWRRLKLLSIVEVNRLLVIRKMLDRLLLSMWANFMRWSKKVGFWKGLKKKYYNLCTKFNLCRKHQGKMIYLNLKLGK